MRFCVVAVSLFLAISCRHSPERSIQSTPSKMIPAVCFQKAAEISFATSNGIDSRFASCTDDVSPVRRGAHKPELSSVYFQNMSIDFYQMGSCLGIPESKHFIPKFTGESGFYPNALGPFGELGLGQLTQAAVNDINPTLNRIRKEFQTSTDPSCRALADEETLWSKVDFTKGCSLTTESSAKKNLLFAFIYERLLRTWIESDFVKFEIEKRFSDLGLHQTVGQELQIPSWHLDPKKYHRQDLIGVLTAVSYNVGARGVVQYLSQYLDLRGKSGLLIDKSHFNFKNDLSWINKLSLEQQKQIPISKISFPAYLKLYQKWGHPGYGPDMMKLIYRFNEDVGYHICTPERIEGYLAL